MSGRKIKVGQVWKFSSNYGSYEYIMKITDIMGDNVSRKVIKVIKDPDNQRPIGSTGSVMKESLEDSRWSFVANSSCTHCFPEIEAIK